MLGTAPLLGLRLRRRSARARLERLMAETRAGRSISTARRRPLRRREPARRDPEGALPRRAHPRARRADRGADAAGGRGLFTAHAAPGGARAWRSSSSRHKLDEVLALAAPHRRPARRAARSPSWPRGGRSRQPLAALMVGREVDAKPAAAGARPAPRCSRLSDVTLRREGRESAAWRSIAHRTRRRDRRHRRRLGQRPARRWRPCSPGSRARPAAATLILGEPPRRGPRPMIARGVGRITEDRHHEGIVGDLSVAENLDPGAHALAARSSASAACATAPSGPRPKPRSGLSTCAAPARMRRSACCRAATCRS